MFDYTQKHCLDDVINKITLRGFGGRADWVANHPRSVKLIKKRTKEIKANTLGRKLIVLTSDFF